MDVHVGTLTATVEAGSGQPAGQQVEEIVREVLRRLEAQRGSETARREDTTLWNSSLGGPSAGSGGGEQGR